MAEAHEILNRQSVMPVQELSYRQGSAARRSAAHQRGAAQTIRSAWEVYSSASYQHPPPWVVASISLATVIAPPHHNYSNSTCVSKGRS